MNNLNNIANLITIRNFLTLSIDNMYVKLSRDDVKAIQQKIYLIDQTIVKESLLIDVKESLLIDVKDINYERIARKFISTEDTEVVLNKFISVPSGTSPMYMEQPSYVATGIPEMYMGKTAEGKSLSQEDELVMPQEEVKTYKIIKGKRIK